MKNKSPGAGPALLENPPIKTEGFLSRCVCVLVYTAVAAAVIFAAVAPTVVRAEEVRAGARELSLFFSPTCHECQKIKNSFLPRLMDVYGRTVTVVYYDISQKENFKRLFDLTQVQGHTSSQTTTPSVREIKVPSVYFAGRLLIGGGEIRQNLERLLTTGNPAPIGTQNSTGSYNPLAYFTSFTPVAVIAAGLVDGINPCAFTVIVFFVSFLALQGFRKRRLVLVGSVFIFGVFITYLLIGLGLFGFFYTINAFWWVRTAVNWAIGILSIGFGIAAMIDAAKYTKTKQTDGMLLSLPQAVKNKIHSVIGMRYRASEGSPQDATLMRLVAVAFVTGVLVSLLEAVCTGQMYLPTIIFVLKSTPVTLVAWAYLVLYNIMFIVPLAGVLALAVTGVSSGQFSRFMTTHLLLLKILMAIMFFALGIFLLWRG